MITAEHSSQQCVWCSEYIEAGDEVYDTGEAYIHEECIYAYLPEYLSEQGWSKFIANEERP